MSRETSVGRRAFVQGVAATVLLPELSALSGCSSGGSGGSGMGMPEGGGSADVPWSVWSAMREALKSSPDSFGDQTAKLVADKDAKGLFSFVRDNIATLPSPALDTDTSRRWGTAATLRGGAGTARERADLLAQLLTQAGLDATVVSGAPTSDLADTAGNRAALIRSIPRTFHPAEPPASIGSWAGALGGTKTSPAPLDPTGAQAEALYRQISSLIPTGLGSSTPAAALFNVPLVALKDGKKTTYLNPLLPKAEYGNPYATNITPAKPADALPTVTAVLSICRASDPATMIPLIQATYSVDQVAGRQLVVQMQPTASPADYATMPLSSLQSFVSTISVTGADMSSKEKQSLLRTGPTVTLGGDLLVKEKDGTITSNGIPLGKGPGGGSASSVAQVTVAANASAFPQIELKVRATDGAGKAVGGLGASAFQVTEDGAGVSFVLRDNAAAGPRVLFVADRTGSEPAFSAAWADAVATAVFKAAPDATVQVVAVDVQQPSAMGYTLQTAAAVSSALQGLPGSVTSDLYRALGDAVKSAPSLIVLTSDGNVEDPAEKSLALTALAAGVPVLAVTCSTTAPTPDSPTMDGFAQTSGGTSVNGADLTNAALVTKPLSQMLTDGGPGGYRISYTAPTTGPSKRSVVVTAHAPGKTTYDLPATPSPQSAVAGLYLTLTVGGETVTRVLGGFLPGGAPSDEALVKAAVADAAAAMLGTSLISFEAGAPSVSTWMADIIPCRLATRSTANALAKKDYAGAMSASAGVPANIPTELLGLHCRLLPAPGVVTFEQSLRAVHVSLRAGPVPYRADLLPMSRFCTSGGATANDNFKATLKASLRLAIAEDAYFERSTMSLLHGKTLKVVPPGSVTASDLPSGVPAAQVAPFVYALNQYGGNGDYYRLVAEDGSAQAFWAIHRDTGTCIGVMPDGTGGAADLCADYKATNAAFGIISIFCGVLGFPALGMIASIGQLVLLAGVETLLAFANSPVTTRPGEQGAQIACTIGGALLGGVTPPKPVVVPLGAADKAIGSAYQGYTVYTAAGQFSICNASACP